MKHFKQKAKRIFAAMLCLCMIASVLPMGASAADAEENLKLVFNDAGLTVTSGVTDKGDYNGADQLLATKEGDWVAYPIGSGVIPAGDYDAVLKYTTSGLGCIVDFYVVKASNDVSTIDAALTSDDPVISELDFVTSGPEQNNEKSFSVNISEAGEYMFVAKAKKKTGGLYFWLEDLEMQWTPLITETINFKIGDDRTYYLQNMTAYNESSNANWRYYAHAASQWTDDNGEPLTLDKMLGKPTGEATDKACYNKTYGIEIYAETSERWMAFAIDVKKPGIYLLDTTAYCYNLGAKVDFYMFPENDVNVADDATALQKEAAIEENFVAANYAGQMNQKVANGSEGNYSKTLPNQIVVPKAGEYVLVMKCAEKYWMYLETLALRRVGDAPQPEQNPDGLDVLGENYAILRRDASGSYIVDLFGGVKVLDGYSEVGFEVKVNDGEAEKFGDSKVYTGIDMQGDNDVTPDKFGEDASHVFYQTIDNLGSDDTITFRAYALKADGKTYVYGYEYTVDVVAQ